MAYPSQLPALISAALIHQVGIKEIIITPQVLEMNPNLLDIIHQHVILNRVLLKADEMIATKNETVQSILDKGMTKGIGEVYICKGFECGLPIQTESELKQRLFA